MDIANGIVNLVEIFGIVVVGGHAFQSAYHLATIVAGQHLCLSYSGVELQLVRRIASDYVFKGIVGLLLITKQILYLTHKEPLAGPLGLAAFVLYCFIQIRYGLLVIGLANVVVGVSKIPVFNGTEVH